MTTEEYEGIDLRAHSLLADVPLHDVWRVDLPGGKPGLTLPDLRAKLSSESFAAASPAVRLVFALRRGLGRALGWDREPPHAVGSSFADELSAAERDASLVAPGTPDGPFRVVLVSPRESISEVANATVHACSVFALVDAPKGYRLYWAIYVEPVGRITTWYMALIDPFRRLIVYPAILRRIREVWAKIAVDEPTE